MGSKQILPSNHNLNALVECVFANTMRQANADVRVISSRKIKQTELICR